MKKAASQEYGQGKCVVVWAALVLTCFTVIYIYIPNYSTYTISCIRAEHVRVHFPLTWDKGLIELRDIEKRFRRLLQIDCA